MGTLDEIADAREAARISNNRQFVNNSASFYKDNILNEYETYTYSWAIHMINPTRAQEFETNITDGTYITLAETGVENEISLETVIQNTTLGFVRDNRNAVANTWDITFQEANGMTFLNRIMLAAKELGIRNHIEASYLLELKFRGWKQDNTSMKDEEIGPFWYVASITDFQIKHQDSGTNYQVAFVETESNAYRRMDYHLKTDLSVSASTFGEFLTNFTDEINKETARLVETTITRLYPNIYEFGTEGAADEWKNWKFDAVRGENLQESRNVSVTSAGGVVTFTLAEGTSMTAAIAAAILQTKEFKKIPLVGRNRFAKDNTDDAVADFNRLSELMQWFMFSTKVEYMEPYDSVAKQYKRKFIYNIKAYAAPQGVHDPISFKQLAGDSSAQQARMNNILRNGLLRKRYDYTYTGLNTEVLDVDLSLNTIFFVTQAIAGGRMGANQQFPGLTTAESAAYDARQRYATAVSEVKRLETERTRLEEKLSQVDPRNEDGQLARTNREYEANTAAIDEAQRNLELKEQTLEESNRQLFENTNTESVRFNPTKFKYITQSDLYDGNTRFSNKFESDQTSMQFDYRSVNDSLASSGADTNDDPGTAMLGALEINLNATGELVEQRLNIKGDPYWLGKPKGAAATNDNQADYEFGGLGYFFNMRLPVNEGEDGLMPEEIFNVTALYRVKSVTSQYMMGEFKQTLDSIRDTNTNNTMLINQLLAGATIGDQPSSLKSNYHNTNDDTDPQPDTNGNVVNDTSSTLDPSATGSGNGTITGSRTGVDGRLLTAMESAAASTGLTGVITPRGGNRGPGGSGRHNGYAADVQLYDGNRLLSVENPQDLALIQNYTSAFLTETRSAGLVPSVGIANPAYGSGSGLYMSGVAHHYDIAMTPGIGANLSPNAAPYWGGSGERTKHHRPPTWLVNMYNNS
jgi:hypothetical protein